MFKLKFFNIIIGFFFFLEVCLLLSSVSFAAGSESDSYFPMGQNDNSVFQDYQINYITSVLDPNGDNYYFCKYSHTGTYVYFWGLSFPKSSGVQIFAELNNNGYQFSLYQNASDFGLTIYSLRFYGTRGYYDNNGSTGFGNFSNLESSLYNTSCSYISNFNVYSNNTNNKSLVLFYENDIPSDWFPTTGHSHAPENLNIPVGTNIPSSPTGPRIWTRYTWSQYVTPQLDFSTVTDSIESIGDILTYSYGYLKDNINGDISNLGDNIIASIESVVKNIQYYGNNIANNLVSFINNFYQNMTSLLQPITVPFLTILALGTDPETGFFSIPYLTKTLFLPNPSDVTTILLSNDVLGIVEFSSDLSTFTGNVKTQLMSGSNDVYGLTLPAFVLGGVTLGPYFIDFSWYLDYKDTGDAIISAFLVLGFFMWLHWRLPYWLRSEQGDIVGYSKEVQK